MSTTTAQATFTAPAISCGHCVARVQNAVGAVTGVDKVEANAETKQVAVTYDAAATTPEAIRTALADAGYPAAD
jgi:copper ion binding protein